MNPIEIGRWIIAIVGYGVAIGLMTLFAFGLFYSMRYSIPEKDRSDFRHGLVACPLFAMVAAIITTVLLKIL